MLSSKNTENNSELENLLKTRIKFLMTQEELSKPYSLINFNCEHFVNYVQHGKVESKQIDFALGLGAFVLLIGLVASIND